METRIDQVVGGIYRISTMLPPFGITFNQFLIDDEKPVLIHTGEHDMYENIRSAVAQVLDPAKLAHVALLHWEGDENGGMDRFLVVRRNHRQPLSGGSLSATRRSTTGGSTPCTAAPSRLLHSLGM